ncbi:Protein of uncharacterised function (DUF501) [Acidipropionibacterium jensenii]|uniref:Protein of uncharacterized function (DUF501) n=1 Tax=Acidipropionibacterium jensenii TaxID=1749 RepID=A0A3S4WUZ0_9ACTN|nr:DUF501 domain-containing protein [Corynebacterium variabile]VEI01921.1 Protein of uncharacterised function (DUF501) [Acidipropionibacterium jensenii]
MTRIEPFTDQDRSAVADQLGREPRAVVGVAWRCSCGRPGVIATLPRLPGGSPFPTTYYLTCPALASRIGTIEASGEMARMAARLGTNPALAESYRRAHLAYLADRAHFAEQAGLAPVPEIEGISAGGMPTRVKCLHALAAHALAVGPGVNPFGDEVVAILAPFLERHRAATADTHDTSATPTAEDPGAENAGAEKTGAENPASTRTGAAQSTDEEIR